MELYRRVERRAPVSAASSVPLIFCTNEEGRAEWLKSIIIYRRGFIQAFNAPDRGARLPPGRNIGRASCPPLPRAFLFIQILFIILSVIYIICFYYLLTFKREKVYIMNALMPRFFLMFSCGPIPGAFLNSGPVTRCFFFLFRDFTQ